MLRSNFKMGHFCQILQAIVDLYLKSDTLRKPVGTLTGPIFDEELIFDGFRQLANIIHCENSIVISTDIQLLAM